MTTYAVTAKPITVTIRGTCIARTFTLGSIEARDGTPLMELSRYVLNAIEGLLTTLWCG